MPVCVDIAALDRVAIGKQHRVAPLLGRYRRRVACHYIGPINEISDSAKALRLALRAEIAARHVETRKRSIALRGDAGLDIESQRHELQRFAIEMQRSSALSNRRVAADTET